MYELDMDSYGSHLVFPLVSCNTNMIDYQSPMFKDQAYGFTLSLICDYKY